MSAYSIKDLEVISGIKAHTIRIWEQRYQLLVPQRTDTNIRLYNDDQMRRLLNITTLIDNGFKVSKVASLSDAEIYQKVEEFITDTTADVQIKALINEIISAGLSYNEKRFTTAYAIAIDSFGITDTYIKVIYPMLIRVGLMWLKHDLIPSQEHFISNLIKQKLFTAIDSLKEPSKDAQKWILLLPEDEDHEIGLLLSSFLLKSKGKKVIYLGQRVPYSNIESIIKSEEPDYIHFFMIRNQSVTKCQKIVNTLNQYCSDCKVIVSGSKFLENELSLPPLFSWMNSIEQYSKL